MQIFPKIHVQANWAQIRAKEWKRAQWSRTTRERKPKQLKIFVLNSKRQQATNVLCDWERAGESVQESTEVEAQIPKYKRERICVGVRVSMSLYVCERVSRRWMRCPKRRLNQNTAQHATKVKEKCARQYVEAEARRSCMCVREHEWAAKAKRETQFWCPIATKHESSNKKKKTIRIGNYCCLNCFSLYCCWW